MRKVSINLYNSSVRNIFIKIIKQTPYYNRECNEYNNKRKKNSNIYKEKHISHTHPSPLAADKEQGIGGRAHRKKIY